MTPSKPWKSSQFSRKIVRKFANYAIYIMMLQRGPYDTINTWLCNTEDTFLETQFRDVLEKLWNCVKCAHFDLYTHAICKLYVYL